MLQYCQNWVYMQGLTLTLFPTCPVGQIEKKSTWLALFFGCPNLLLYAVTLLRVRHQNKVKQLSIVLCLFWKSMHSVVLICFCCFNVQNCCFYSAFTYSVIVNFWITLFRMLFSLRDWESKVLQCHVHHMVSKTTYKWLFTLWIWVLSIDCSHSEYIWLSAKRCAWKQDKGGRK